MLTPHSNSLRLRDLQVLNVTQPVVETGKVRTLTLEPILLMTKLCGKKTKCKSDRVTFSQGRHDIGADL